MSARFVYTLCGGPYSGKKIVGADQQRRIELYHHSAYAQHSTALVVYGSRSLQMNKNPRLLYYWGSRAADPNTVQDPTFYNS